MYETSKESYLPPRVTQVRLDTLLKTLNQIKNRVGAEDLIRIVREKQAQNSPCTEDELMGLENRVGDLFQKHESF